MKKILFLILVMMLVITGCGGQKQESNISNQNNETKENNTSGDNSDSSQKEQTQGFEFEYHGVTIPMNVDAAPILEQLGESMDYFEAPSCAFQGLDKIFYYSGFELSTYPQGDKDIVSSVNFLDDTVTTKEGLYLGASLEEVLDVYGNDYTEENGFYTYTQGDSKLTFVVENDVVESITYSAVVEGVNE